MTFEIVNSISQKSYTFEVEDTGRRGMYYSLPITLPEGVDDGEYQYTLRDGDRVLHTGILRVGDFVATAPSVYDGDNEAVVYQG